MKNPLYAILHADSEFGIGKNNALAVHLPKDMAFFRETTRGHVVAMGENTLLSFPGSKPLKNRTNIVLSQDVTHDYAGCVNVHTFEDFLQAIASALENDVVYIIGGASIYRQTLPYVSKVYLTKVHEVFGADVFFPNLDQDPAFELLEESEPIEDEGHTISFCVYRNRSPEEIR